MRHLRKCECVHDLVEEPEGKSLIGRRRHKWEDNITMNLKGI